MGIDGISLTLGEWSIAGLLALVVILILSGRLVPKSTLDAQKKETDYWRETFFKSQETNQVLANALSEITESARTQDQVMKSIQKRNTEGAE